LSVESQLYAEVGTLFDVRPSAFHPPPKVDSALIGFRLRPRELSIDSPDEFLKFVRLCFQHKRKTIRNNLAAVYGSEAVANLPEASMRAEQLSIAQFAEMWKKLSGGAGW
jgi:16S rRNA (adenine1518-N6/adenine1519-N6)-dimethyltransferase